MSPESTTDVLHSRQDYPSINVQGARFFRWTEASLHALWTLPINSQIVLFTPAVPPANSAGRRESFFDPLQAIGEAISDIHGTARVAQVPFVPERGLLDLHLPFIQSADAVIVVTLKPAHSEKEVARLDNSNQENFVTQVCDTIRATRAGGVGLLLCCVQFGSTDFEPPVEYGNVIRCASYTENDLFRVAALLTGR